MVQSDNPKASHFCSPLPEKAGWEAHCSAGILPAAPLPFRRASRLGLRSHPLFLRPGATAAAQSYNPGQFLTLVMYVFYVL